MKESAPLSAPEEQATRRAPANRRAFGGAHRTARRRGTTASAALLAAVLGVSWFVLAPPAQAVSFTVKNLNDSGQDSLRTVIAAANASAGRDTITFQAGLTGTIALTSGEIEITEGVTITGPGSGTLSVDGGGLSRIFDIHADSPGASAVSISGLTLKGGKAPLDPAPVTPGDLLDAGAIVAESAGAGALTLTGVVMSNNVGGDGGAVMARNLALTVNGSTFSGNTSQFGGGAIRSFGSVVQINDSTLSGNSAVQSGGALRVSGGSLAVRRTSIKDNMAGSAGGVRAASGATVAISDSAITGNNATGVGVTGIGGGMVLDDLATGSSSVTRSLIANNTAAANAGGADIGTGGYTFSNVTVTGNSASNQAGGLRFDGGTTVVTGATIAGNTAGHGGGVLSTGPGGTIRNSILANNNATVDPAEREVTVNSVPDDGPVKLDYTLVETPPIAGSTTAVTPGSVIFAQDPQLEALGAHGGATQTMRPGPASPALDKGKSFGLTTDQRGRGRPVNLAGVANAAGGDGADMGAVELSSPTDALVIDNVVAPKIAGTARVGATLKETSSGTWSQPGVTLTRAWLRNGAVIAGATGTSYVLKAADLGKRVSLRVTATKPQYTSDTATSAPSALVARGTLVTTGTAKVLGTLKVGRTLTAVAPSCRPAATRAYQWMRNGVAIRNATKSTYKLGKADVGKRIRVRITLSRAGYTSKVFVAARLTKVS